MAYSVGYKSKFKLEKSSSPSSIHLFAKFFAESFSLYVPQFPGTNSIHYDNDFVSNIERFLERNALEDTQPYTDEEIEVALQC